MSKQPQLVEVERSDNEVIRIDAREYNGHRYIDIRTFYRKNGSGWKPTRKGLTLPVSRSRVEALAGGLASFAASMPKE